MDGPQRMKLDGTQKCVGGQKGMKVDGPQMCVEVRDHVQALDSKVLDFGFTDAAFNSVGS